MADVQILAPGVAAAPLSYVIPGAQEIVLKSLFATFDGSGAAGTFLPCVRILAPGGKVVGEFVTDTSVAAGASAEVSFGPFLGRGSTLASGAGIPPFPALDDYVFQRANTSVTGVGFNNQASLIIQGNPVSLDGATRVKIEFFAPLVEVVNGPVNQAIGFSLWDGTTNKGVIGYMEGNFNPTLASQCGGPVYGVIIDTPAAGTHTYAVYAFKNTAGGTNTVYGNTFVDGTGNLGPCWYRVTTT